MFAGIGGFRTGLTRAGGFQCVGHCEIDKYANASYEAIYEPGKEERYYHDAKKIDPADLPDFYILCGGFPWGIMSNGWCLTANILESRNPEGGCSLSAILIPDAPEKYFLSSAQVEKLLYKSSEARKAPVSTTQTE